LPFNGFGETDGADHDGRPLGDLLGPAGQGQFGFVPFKFGERPFVVSAGEGTPYNRSLSCLRQRSTGGHHSPRKKKYAAPQVNWAFRWRIGGSSCMGCMKTAEELLMTSGQVWASDAPETESTVSTAPGTFATASDPPSANRIR
jgi:hypothetical protein